VVLRIFLGATQGLIVLLEGPRPVAWRSLPMVRGAELGMIVSVVRMLNVLRPNFGMERPIDVALIHGRMDLSSQLSEETLRAELGVPVIGCEQPDWAPDAVAYGLADGCLTPNVEALDLAGSLKPQPRLREIFPWGELAVQTAILACMAMLLAAHSNRLAEAHAAAKAEARKYSSLATASVADLKQEEKDLQGRVEAIERFLSSRVIWTAYTHDLANRLPPRTTFTSLQGLAELESPGKRNAAKRSLRVEAAVPVQADGTMPPEIDEFLDSLRGHSMLEREFGAVELNLIKVQQKGEQPMASLSILSERGKKKVTPAREEGR
jgi:Tfp pilus assembly protein PilN